MVRFAFQARFDARGVSVAGDIGERLLKDAEDGSGSFRIEGQALPGQTEMTADSGTAFELLSMPFQGSSQAQVIQSSGPELRGDSSQGDDHLVHQSNGGVHFSPRLSLSHGCLATEQCEIHLDCRTSLAELVMDFSSD